LGGAVLTSAGRLPLRAIIHGAGIDMLWRASEFSVRESVRSAMRIAAERRFSSVAVPLIGAGSGGATADRSLAWMTDELSHQTFEGEVRVVRYL
jgi:O-acetyl-ADP-ribose deacetylase (regulator of RNase III)